VTPTVPSTWRTGCGELSLEAPLYLGILNVTPDSFSDGGRFLDPAAALRQARDLRDQGAQLLDLGAESTRPGAAPVSPEEEWARLEPVLALLAQALPEVPVSLDTRHALVAARGIRMGAAVINDVTGFRDPELLHVALNSGCGLIAMRSRLEDGALVMPPYGGAGAVSSDRAVAELAEVRDRVLGAGIAPERVLLDPGFGFGTTFGEDRSLWGSLSALPALLDWPAQRFCLGISRKRFLAWRAGNPTLSALERDPHGARAHREAQALGYRVFRTHAVSEPRVRPALAADAGLLGQVQVDSWRATYKGILPEALLSDLDAECRAAGFRQAIETGGTRLWTLEARGRIMGFAAAGPCREAAQDAEATGELHAIYLLPEAWGQGLGYALMERALDGLREAGFSRAVLWVLERNSRGRNFYEKSGWKPCGQPRTEWMDGIALREVQYSQFL
jgi:dihydropteroate synthase